MNKAINYQFALLLLILFIFTASSCSVTFEKRKYRPGYHVDMVQHSNSNGHYNDVIKANELQTKTLSVQQHQDYLKTTDVKLDDGRVDVVLKSDKKNALKPKLILEPKQKFFKDECDYLILKDGIEMEVIIIEISDTEIKYKKCNNQDGPTYIISSEKVEVINLRNGDFYRPQYQPVRDTDDGRMNGYLTATLVMAILALISATMGFIFAFFTSSYLAVIGFIIGCISLAESVIATALGLGGLKSKSPKATMSIIMGVIAFILSILAIVLLFI